MTSENLDEITDLLDESLETVADKKQFAKTQTAMIKECAEKNGVDKSTLKRVMKYHHYSGANWLNGNPLEKDPAEKKKDKVAPTFIKLVSIIEDLATIGDKDFLKPYLDAVLSHGIKIDIDYGSPNINDSTDVILDTLDSASKLQTSVDTLADELKDEKSQKAEELNFAPKEAFMKMLSLYDKIKNDQTEKAEDAINQGASDALMMTNAYTYLASQIDKSDED